MERVREREGEGIREGERGIGLWRGRDGDSREEREGCERW